MRCLAIDWSGRARSAERHLWLAEARDGRLQRLENGRSREETVAWVIAAATQDRELVAGFDFAFSFPAWYCARRGWATGPEVWAAIAQEGEALLAACPPPFWGRPGVGRRGSVADGLRRTDVIDIPGAKSVFQIGGSGTVGTGSLRGMGLLPALTEAGFSVWPFTGSALPLVMEIYPRAMYGRGVRKRRAAEREHHLADHWGDQDPDLLALAAGSEDAFDAAVSALVMSRHADRLRALPACPGVEGRVWVPTES